MDIAVHWGVLRHLRSDVNAKAWVLVSAIVLDIVVLAAFLFIKGSADPMIVVIAIVSITVIFLFEKYFLARRRRDRETESSVVHEHD